MKEINREREDSEHCLGHLPVCVRTLSWTNASVAISCQIGGVRASRLEKPQKKPEDKQA